MAIDFSDKRVTMVVCPVDGRYGFYALSDLAFKLLHIDIYKQEDYVVFVSRSRGICKIILQVVKRSLKAQKRSRHFS